jgi:hypothetical protein
VPSRPCHRNRTPAALLTVLLLAGGLSACGIDEVTEAGASSTTDPSSSSSSSTTEPDEEDPDAPLIDQEEALEAVEVFMTANNEANSTLDTTVLVNIETGAAAAIDEAWYRGQRTLGTTEASTFTWEGVKVYVPRQQEYPARFLATLSYDVADPPNTGIQIQVYEKASASAPWKLSHYDNMGAGSPLPELDVDDEGYVNELDPATLAIAPEDVTKELGTIMKDPAAESRVETSDQIDEHRKIITERIAEDSKTTLNHEVTYDTPTSPGYPTYTFPLSDGGALVLGVLGVREIITPVTPGDTVEVEADFSEGLVPAGDQYTRIEMRSLIAYAATVPAADDDGPIRMLALYQGIISAKAEGP